MAYTIVFDHPAEKQLEKLPFDVQTRILNGLYDLAQDPRAYPGVKALEARSGFRIRFGSYRVVFDIDHQEILVLVLRIADRKDAYR